MAFGNRRTLSRVVLAAMFVLSLWAVAAAALERPNALDRHVDALAQSALLSQPATALVDPARQSAALRRAHWTLVGWVLIQLFAAAALFYLWSSGGAAALRDWLRRRFRNEWSVRFLFGAALALVARLAAFVPSFYLYRVDRTLDLTTELTRTWGLWWVFHTLVGMIVAGVIAAIVLWLAERTHQWYVYMIVGILAASVAWSYAAPYLQSPGTRAYPLRNAALAAQLDALLTRAQLPHVPVVIENIGNAPFGGAVVVLGFGGSRRVALSERVIAGNTPPEIRYVVAYELGHIMHGDLLSIALIEGGVIIVFAALAVVIADRIRFRRDDDPLSRLTIVGALLALVYLAAVPVRNAALRSYDFDADRYAVVLTGDPAAAVRALVRTADQRMEEVCPEQSATLFLYTSPGIGARVARINRVPSACP
jgi:STE24 endopeptidase